LRKEDQDDEQHSIGNKPTREHGLSLFNLPVVAAESGA